METEPLFRTRITTCSLSRRYVRGDFFGERALMSNEPRAASVRACGSLRLQKLDRTVFESVIAVSCATELAARPAKQNSNPQANFIHPNNNKMRTPGGPPQ